MIKALFFDIDGTLVSFKSHEIPASAVSAIAEAKERGAKVFISTGRPLAFINNLGAISHLIDGYITTNGARCSVGGREVGLAPIPPSDMDTLSDYIDSNSVPCVLMGVNGIAALHRTDRFDQVLCGLLKIPYREVELPADEIRREPVLQVTPFIDEEQESALLARLKGCMSARWFPDFCDITSREADKGRGLLTVARHLGIDVSETMAFGDGGNDVPILRAAGVGVAMGNALDSVKAAAGYVTTDIDDDGVRNALLRFNVIG